MTRSNFTRAYLAEGDVRVKDRTGRLGTVVSMTEGTGPYEAQGSALIVWDKGGAYGGTVGGTDQQRAAMEALNAEGACTALAVLGASASAADPDHGQQITRRLTNLDGLALLFREVASRMIEERLSA